MPARETWQKSCKLEFRKLLNYESTVFKVNRFLQDQVVNSLAEHSFLVIIKRCIFPFFKFIELGGTTWGGALIGDAWKKGGTTYPKS